MQTKTLSRGFTPVLANNIHNVLLFRETLVLSMFLNIFGFGKSFVFITNANKQKIFLRTLGKLYACRVVIFFYFLVSKFS